LKNRSHISETRAYAAVCTSTQLGFSFVSGSQRAITVETAPVCREGGGFDAGEPM
jgi:hypothetical protein